MIVALTLVVLVMAVSTPGDKPKALREFERARSAERMTTVRAEILLIEPGAGIAGGDFRGFTFFEAVGPEYCVTSRGDEDGVVALVNGKPRTDFGPLYSYVADGEAWSREERGTFVHVDSHRAGSSHDPFDLRTLGSNPWCFGKDLETFAREAGLGTPTYSERTDGGLYVVTAELTKAQARWWLDPEKDWSVVRTQVLNEGAVQFEQVITVAYDRHDQMWFPSRVEEYRRAAGESSPSRIIEVLGVEFNRPDHKVDLSPVDVGVEPGMQVIFQNHQPVDGGYWDGSRVVKRDEFKAGIDAGTIAMGIGTRRLTT